MSGIRVTYSGLISFVFGISSVITGLIFTLIVTRNLTQTEFGTWSLIGGLTSYVLIINPIIAYWTTREIARGNKIAKTSLLSSSSLSVLAVGIYLIIRDMIYGKKNHKKEKNKLKQSKKTTNK